MALKVGGVHVSLPSAHFIHHGYSEYLRVATDIRPIFRKLGIN